MDKPLLMLRSLLFFLLIGLIDNVSAETLLDAKALKEMEDVLEWPIVDARELSERSMFPISGALEFEPGLFVEGKVLVVASDNATAALVARAIESRIRTTEVFVIDGGYETLRVIRMALPSSTSDILFPGTFTIPSDTCQPGNPLHIYTDE